MLKEKKRRNNSKLLFGHMPTDIAITQTAVTNELQIVKDRLDLQALIIRQASKAIHNLRIAILLALVSITIVMLYLIRQLFS